MARDERVDAYIAGAADFARPILGHLREILHRHRPDAVETIKWGMPFFVIDGRPFAHMAAFKHHASFGFWDRGATATGREGEGMGQFGRITAIADLPDEATIAALIDRALNDARRAGGATRPLRAARTPRPEAEVPPTLAAALARDAAALATWTGFPPGCRREYCDWVADAKRDETRERRVAQTIAQLREGKRHNWRYGA